jgi:hypothetical protein
LAVRLGWWLSQAIIPPATPFGNTQKRTKNTLKNRFFTLAKKHQIAVVVLLLESLGATFSAAVFIAGTIMDAISRPKIFAIGVGGYISIDAIFLASAVFGFFVARQLINKKRWARSAAVYWQIIQIAFAINSFSGDFLGKVIGLWLIGSSLVGLYALFSREVIDATGEKVDLE